MILVSTDMYSLDSGGPVVGRVGGRSCPSSSSDENARGEPENGFRTAGAGLGLGEYIHNVTQGNTIDSIDSIYGQVESMIQKRSLCTHACICVCMGLIVAPVCLLCCG